MCNSVNDEIKEALLKRAKGYDVEEKEVILDKNRKETGKIKVTKKHIPPSVSAIKTIRRMIDLGEW